jgi:hypothetical protein
MNGMKATMIDLRGRRMAALLLRLVVVVLAVFTVSACDRLIPQRDDTTLPPVDSVAAIFAANGITGDVAYSGNVIELRVMQPRPQLERGGSLWARVGPYVYLMTPATRELFQRWAGIAAVRVITATGDGEEVARALLLRDTFGPSAWQRTLNLLGLALRDGTERPTQLEALADWGERHTEHQYNPNFVPRGGGAR